MIGSERPRPKSAATYPVSLFEEFRNDDECKKVSRHHLQNSGFITLLTDLALLMHGGLIEDNIEEPVVPPPQLKFMNGYFVAALWNEKRIKAGILVGDAIIAESAVNGSIIVHGGYGGSTVLLIDEWKDRIDLQIQAIERAKRNPARLVVNVVRA